ncbi:MAG: V-type ATP synthase subunit F [Candidatus Hodarchaeaceae archaeon]|nr:V-type ATP synthase subunit F [Candidatus Hodarchaeaceae archaeon]
MSYNIAAVGDVDTVTGFALASVPYTHVHVEKGETLAKLRELFARGDIGLVLITHRVVEELGEEFRWIMRAKKLLPVVLRIPDKTGFTPEIDELRELIRRTVGTKVVEKIRGS